MMESRESMLIMAAASSLMLLMMTAKTVDGVPGVGINWGRQTSQKLLPSMVVDMCLANGIKKVKLFSINEGVLSAFSNSKIEVMVTIPTTELTEKLGSLESTKRWVKSSISYYTKMDVDIRYIGIGVEPFSFIEMKDSNSKYYRASLPKYYKQIQLALEEEKLGDKIKITIPHGTDVLKPFTKPSEADFRDDIKPLMIDILKHHDAYDTPFMVNIFPHVECMTRKLPMEFGYFDGPRNFTITDGSLEYENMFDMLYDAFLWALRKNGFDKIKVTVGQTGWPTDGHVAATAENAKRYFSGFLGKVAKSTGTPLQPGKEFESYLYALVDENERRYDRGAFERHYGIYFQDGSPKFNIDFTLQGRDIEPERAVGISYMPQRWCVLDREAAGKNLTYLDLLLKATCNKTDCTRLAVGGSCGHLDLYDRLSYAFNTYFQQRNQDIINGEACNFQGLGKVTDRRPEFGSCIFRVNVLSTLFLNQRSTGEMEFTLGVTPSASAGERVRILEPISMTVLPLLWLLFAKCLT